MAFISKSDIKDLYTSSKREAREWKEDYPAYERLANNGLIENLDPNLPEVNDGSLAAALFKLPKRIVSSRLTGRAKAMDRDEAFISELANIQWTDNITKNANAQAPFARKWKDAVRKSAIYGSVPIINFFVQRGNYSGSDFIVAQPQDVTLECGKISDYDSDLIFWDIFYSKSQLESIIEEAEKQKESKGKKSVNKWNIPLLKDILASKELEERESEDTPKEHEDKGDVKPKGYKFVVVFQRGIDAPFYMWYQNKNKVVREWSNPDPTGDIPCHYLYCYQDFVNPYGIGIVKLAGGTQNVLDYMRQADVLATQLGLRPPINIQGDADSADIDSLVYSQDAMWFTGNAIVKREELTTGVYQQLPERMAMYKTSLNQLIPLGDTSIAAGSGDPQYSKTPAGIKFQAASLSIDDEDYKDNLYVTYESVAKSMINTHFANMEGSDLMKLTDDEREILIKAGMEFPENENGEMSNEMEIVWDTVRAKFDFEVDPEQDEDTERKEKLEGFTQILQLVAADPALKQKLAESGKKLNEGELLSEMIGLLSDSDKIITDIGPEDEQIDPMTGQPMTQDMPQEPKDPTNDIKVTQAEQKMAQSDELHELKKQKMMQSMQMTPPQGVQGEMQGQGGQVSDEEVQANVEAVMQEYGVDEQTALAALSAEAQGTPREDIIEALKRMGGSNA
jgi:hypothetical protein